MYVLGLTGGIASGKSTVSKMFSELDVPVICADKIVHTLYHHGTKQHLEILELFGEDILNKDKSINRQTVSQKLTEEPEKLADLEGILHPATRQEIYKQVDTHKKNSTSVVLLDIPLMYTSGWDKFCDSIAVTTCPDELRKERAFERGNLTEEKWQFITSKQLSRQEFKERADHLIPTDTSLEETRNIVKKVLHSISA